MNFKNDCYECIKLIKDAPYFPFREGHLKNEYTNMSATNDGYVISFTAPYTEYLEEGTRPHDIPQAFGRPLPFGIGGRFDNKFHPGSHLHKGFISIDSVRTITDYFINKYKGELR